VLIDGRRPVSAITKLATMGGDAAEIAELLENLLRKGYIATSVPVEETDLRLQYFFTAQAPQVAEDAAASLAQEADTGASELRQQGYYVSIARRASTQAKAGPLTVLIVEDEPLVAKYLGALVGMEGLIPRHASNRDQIVAELRTPPVPDLVIMDVNLPDANGFDVLQRMKSYGRFKDVRWSCDDGSHSRKRDARPRPGRGRLHHQAVRGGDPDARLEAVLGLLPPSPELVAARKPPWNEKDSRSDKSR
jgi:hypothetical protein